METDNEKLFAHFIKEEFDKEAEIELEKLKDINDGLTTEERNIIKNRVLANIRIKIHDHNLTKNDKAVL